MTEHLQPESPRQPLDYPVILASGSPRRRELLHSLGVPFSVILPNVDEEAFHLDHLDPAEVVRFLSRVKAQEVFKYHTEAFVIGADTIVVVDGVVFGKPKDEADARRMLGVLQGRAHEVYTGITVFNPVLSPDSPPLVSDFLCTRVFMRDMTEAEIHTYVATGEPMDKAGAYAIQGYGGTLIERVEGCYFNVVGLSLYLLDQLFARLDRGLLKSSMIPQLL